MDKNIGIIVTCLRLVGRRSQATIVKRAQPKQFDALSLFYQKPSEELIVL